MEDYNEEAEYFGDRICDYPCDYCGETEEEEGDND